MPRKKTKKRKSPSKVNTSNQLSLWKGLVYIHRGVEFCGKHPFATGLFAILSLIGLVLTIVGYNLDRSESIATTKQIQQVKNEIRASSKVDQEIFSPDYSDIRYINMLPEINKTAFIKAHLYWDVGVTSKMIQGNFILQDIYLDICVQLARKYYPPSYYGKDPEEYFSNKVNQELAQYRSLAKTLGAGFGSMETLSASQEGHNYLEKKIKEMVKKVGEYNQDLNFSDWEKLWNSARS